MNRERFDDLASRHFDGSLTPAEERELAAALASSAEARAAFRQIARLEGAAAFLGSAGLLAARRRERRAPIRFAWSALAAAALLACAIGLGWFAMHRGPAPVLRVVACGAGDVIVRNTLPSAASVGEGLRAGDELRAAGALGVAWDDGTTVTLASGASATIARDRGGKRIELSSGSLSASIAHQPAGEAMEFATPQATAVVVGTKLRLGITAAATRLDVDEGTVRLDAGGSSLTVAAGGAALADASGARIAPVRVTTAAELQLAVAHVADGQTILVAPGEYRIDAPLIFGGGVRGVTLRGDGSAASVRITGVGDVRSPIELGGCADLTVSDLTLFDSPEHLVLIHGGDGCVRPHLARLRLTGARDNFVRILGGAPGADTGGTIEDCEFSADHPVDPEGFVAYVDIDGARGWRVSRCRFTAMPPGGSNVASGVNARDGASDTVCERCVFIDCHRAITFGAYPGSGGGTDHVRGVIRNNMIVRHAGVAGDAGISINDSPGTKVLHNTVLLQGTYPDAIEYRFPRASGVVIANNLVDAGISARDGAMATLLGNVAGAEPGWFVDADHGDLHLRTTAQAAIDHGEPVDGCADDIDGEKRPRGAAPDVGADEAR